MNLVQAGLSTRRHRESSFQHLEGAVKVVQSCLSAKKDRERSFHHYGGAVPGSIEIAVFTTAEVL